MYKHRSSVINQYIKQIKNEDIQDIQKSIYARYINIEDIRGVKRKLRKNKDLSTLQQELEHNREVFFTKKEVIKKSSVYFSSEFENFTNQLFLTICLVYFYI